MAVACGYPCVVKPVMSSSGKGQSKIDGPADVQKAWDYAMAGGRVGPGRVIVEGFIDFDYEITQLTVRALGADGEVETHFCEPIGHVQVSGDYVESWQPHRMTPAALAESRRVAKAVTDNLGWAQGLFGVELFVKGDQVWFSEVSPRPHDTGMVTMITQWQNEFELHARAILGLPVDTTLKSPGASAVIYGGVDATGIAFDGVDEAMRVPNSDIRLFGKPESFVKRRMGVALVHDADVDVARTQAKLAAEQGQTARSDPPPRRLRRQSRQGAAWRPGKAGSAVPLVNPLLRRVGAFNPGCGGTGFAGPLVPPPWGVTPKAARGEPFTRAAARRSGFSRAARRAGK